MDLSSLTTGESRPDAPAIFGLSLDELDAEAGDWDTCNLREALFAATVLVGPFPTIPQAIAAWKEAQDA